MTFFMTLWFLLGSGWVGLIVHCCCSLNPCLARCLDIPPDECTVTIAGIINGTYCTLCDGYNTTYILQNCAHESVTNGCEFGCVNGDGYFDGPCNGIPIGYIEPPHIFDTITVSIASWTPGTTNLQVYLTLQNLDDYIWRSASLGISPIVCQPLGPVDCPYIGRGGFFNPFGPFKCNSDGSSATVTF